MEAAMREHLRPLERCVLAMRDRGLSLEQIGERIKRSPEQVERIIAWTDLPRSGNSKRTSARALERRVLALRHRGESYETIGGRFRRSPGFIRRVEGLAHYRRAIKLLS
jgi:hypothetical protein